jgi:uncharacterized membrane protein YagU involved in acid resistance
MYPFLSGMTAMGFLVVALLFIRYWRRTQDGIFVWFALSFAILALTQALPVMFEIPREEHSWVFMLRFLAFGLIIVAILRKNQTTSG